MYKTLHKKQGSVTVQLRFARSSVTFCAKRDNSHAALYFLYNKLPSPVKKAADLVRHGLLIWLFVEMMIYGMTITKLNLPKLQPATRISQGWLFAPLVVGGGLMLIYSILNLISTILKPLSEYKKEAETEKDIAQLNRERGGTE